MSESIVDDIKARIDILNLVGEYTQPKKAGNSYKALCPFHKEKSPSFMNSPAKQIAYCFGCHKGGDIFSFIMEAEKIDFPQAVEFLAGKAGLEYKREQLSKHSKEEKEILMDICRDAVDFFINELHRTTEAKEYIDQRHISKETQQLFQIGYAPEGFDNLGAYLRNKGYTTDQLFKAGVIAQKEGRYYDKYRKRIIFPIATSTGHVVGFGGRIMGEGEPKYLNSPESPIYHKSSLLYGLHLAKEHIKEKDSVIVVEGYMDVVSGVQAGITNIVATSGTAMTKEHARLLKRHTSNVYLLFDNDSPGWQATLRNAEECMKEDLQLYVIDLSSSGVKDLDEFTSKYTLEDFSTLQNNSYSFIEHVLRKYTKQFGTTSLEAKRKVTDTLLPFVHSIQNYVEKEHYLDMIAKTLGVRMEALTRELNNIKTPKIHENVSIGVTNDVLFSTPESLIIAILVTYPELYLEHKDKFVMDEMPGKFQNSIYKLIRDEYTFEDQRSDIRAFLKVLLSQESSRQLELLLLYAEEHNIIDTKEVAQVVLLEKLRIVYATLKKKILQDLKTYQEAKDAVSWKQSYDLLMRINSL